MRRGFFHTFGICLGCIWLTISVLAANAQTQRIGISLPLSGNAAKLAEQFRAGIEWYAKNHAGSQRFELIFVDDGCDEEVGLLAAEDLLRIRPAIAIGYFCSQTASIAAELLAGQDIPIIVNVARSEQLMRDRNKEGWDLWRAAPGDNFPAEAAFAALSKRWRNVPYAVVDDGTIYGRTLVDEFRVRMEEAEIPPLYIDNFRASQSTQAGLIRRLQKSGVKAAFIGASSDDLALIVKNIAELGASFEIAGGEVMHILPYLYEAEPAPEGLLAIMEPEPDHDADLQGLRGELLARDIQPEPFFLYGYAAMQLAANVLANSSENIKERLNSNTFDTILGTVKFDQEGKNLTNRFSLHRWDGKQFQPVE